MKPILIGISGPSASGKSTLVRSMEEDLGDVTIVKLDDFYKGLDHYPVHGQWLNMEVPENINFDSLWQVLIRLKQGEPAYVPVFDKRLGCLVGTRSVHPSNIILTEGFLLFTDKRVTALCDLRVFINVSTNVQFLRRLKREPDLNQDYFHQVVVPMYERYGLPALQDAHYILDGDKSEKEIRDEFLKIVREFLDHKNLPFATM